MSVPLDLLDSAETAPKSGAAPSSFYHVKLWRFGLALVRFMPASILNGLCRILAEGYYRVHPSRREIVIQNLLPLTNNDQGKARQIHHRLFHQFALKLADAWRYENGLPVRSWDIEPEDWNILRIALSRRKGVLLITPHLGNWEIGASLFAQRGIPLYVITQAEPDAQLTELRIAMRARWGVKTLVVGDNSFAFVEILKRLDEGAAVALLVDRPLGSGAAIVPLFGKPFPASSAAAELARASGCALVGATIVRHNGGYKARLLPEFNYNRQDLHTREARRSLTGDILRAFEPQIRQYSDQWYHFVPIWGGAGESSRE